MPSSQKPRLLVVDDNRALVELLTVLVDVSGLAEISGVAYDGREAVERAVEDRPDVALLDVEMPRLRGTRAAELILTYSPGTDVLLHTGVLTPSLEREASALGLSCVEKLTDEDQLRTKLAFARRRGAARDAPRLDPVVLHAYEQGGEEAVTVIDAEETVVHYCSRAAQILDLPFPPVRLTLEEYRHVLRPAEGNELRPWQWAVRRRKPASGIVQERRGETTLTFASRAVPFHDSLGRYLGVAVYWRRLR